MKKEYNINYKGATISISAEHRSNMVSAFLEANTAKGDIVYIDKFDENKHYTPKEEPYYNTPLKVKDITRRVKLSFNGSVILFVTYHLDNKAVM